MKRLATGGDWIDRTTPINFEFDGTTYQGYRGDSLAAALLANGISIIAGSNKFGRPRGVMTCAAHENSAIVQVLTPHVEPNLPATTVEIFEGLAAHSTPGQGWLDDAADPNTYDRIHRHTDLLIIGAGHAGLNHALTAARAGRSVILIDENPQPGGLAGHRGDTETTAALAAVRNELNACANVTWLQRTTVFGVYEDNFVLAVERRGNHRGFDHPQHISLQRIWRIRAGEIIAATGAFERHIAFANNDRPGIMFADAGLAYLRRYGVLVGDNIAIFTTNDSAYDTAFALVEHAAVRVIDTRAGISPELAARAAAANLTVELGSVITDTTPDDTGRIAAITVQNRANPTQGSRHDVDTLLVSGGWNPATQLVTQGGGSTRWDETLAAFLPDAAQAVTAIGTAAGAGLAANDAVFCVPTPTLDNQEAFGRHFIDIQRDATVTDVLHSIDAGLDNIELIKRFTTIGTAHDQGKSSGVLAAGIVAEALGRPVAALGVSKHRPPYALVSFAALAGMDRGDLYDPIRVSAIHTWHEAWPHAQTPGAPMELVGQWLRPRFFPVGEETMHAAVLRECAATRDSVGMMDASTLGKIDISGPDAGVFLDRIYTNMMSTLKVGAVRYAIMLGNDGMLFDDGTVTRLADDRYLATTTTGGAAKVLEWLEEWLQTEWPDLNVRLTSVTEHYATVAVVGPKSRDVLSALVPGVDFSHDAFGFMAWQKHDLGGVPALIGRISFSGELAYEINVPAHYGLSLWEAVYAAGQPYNITPYGTETMHVLRAEKGYPIIGQDTDGTINPYDLGMSWIVSRKKPDFVGKRSLDKEHAQAAGRKHLVGLLPHDTSCLVPEGSQIVATETLPAKPYVKAVPMLGHVTSSYDSAALGRTFCLALVKGGRELEGETVYLPVGERMVAATVTNSVVFDVEGARRDG